MDVANNQHLSKFDTVKMRAGIAAISAFMANYISTSIFDVRLLFVWPNEIVCGISVVGVLIGWYIAKCIHDYVVFHLTHYIPKHKHTLRRWTINYFVVIAALNFLLMPAIIPEVTLDALGLPALAIAILAGFDLVRGA